MRVILSERDWPHRAAVRAAVYEWCRTEPGAPAHVAVALGDFTEVDAKNELMGAGLLQIVHNAIRGEA